MRPGQRVDAVELHEAERVEDAVQVLAPARPAPGAQKEVAVQKEAAGGAVGQKRAGHGPTLDDGARGAPPR